MTPEQIAYMTETRMLFLEKGRRRRHFDPANILKIVAFIFIGIFFFSFIKYGTKNWVITLIVTIIFTSVLFVASHFVSKSQKKKLILTSFSTEFSKFDNYIFAKKTLEILSWKVKDESPDFIEAYNPHRDLRTWGDEMVSIVPLDNEMLINSICNLEKILIQAFGTFGKNQENIAIFKKTFESIAGKEEHST